MKRCVQVAVLAALVRLVRVHGHRRNRPLMNFCETRLVPEDALGRALAAPVVLPVCLAAGVVDTVLIHPVTVIDDAWFDTEAMVWPWTDRGYVTECALFPLRLALTPPKWALQFTSRCLFRAPPWPPSPSRLERQLLDPDSRMRLLAVRDSSPWSYRGADVGPATQAMLKACKAYPKDIDFCEAVIERLPGPLTDAARTDLGRQAQTGRGRLSAAAISRLFVDCSYWAGPRSARDAAGQQVAATVHQLAGGVYDELVRAGHHEAEAYLVQEAGRRARRKGPRALALYVIRSLAKRGWPDYAEAASFRTQLNLIRYSEAARIDAVDYEWRALRLRAGWLGAVREAVRRQQGSGVSIRAALVRKEKEIATKLRKLGPGQAPDHLYLSERLMAVKSSLDAEVIAERLLKGPKADLELFLSNPEELLKKKGGP